MDDIWLPGFSFLVFMGIHRQFIGFFNHGKIAGWMICLDLFNQFQIQLFFYRYHTHHLLLF